MTATVPACTCPDPGPTTWRERRGVWVATTRHHPTCPLAARCRRPQGGAA
jgi:hypothetical protein